MLGRASGRVREDASLRPLPTALAGVLGVSLGVLGWLSAQAATFGVAEHTHLTAHGLTTHRHDYAAPLAAGAGVAALLTLLLLLVVHLSSSQPARAERVLAPRLSPWRLVGRFSPAVAALLFVAVESVEFIGSGTPASAAAAVLAPGAGLQMLTARAVATLTRALVGSIEDLATTPQTVGAAPWAPSRARFAAAHPLVRRLCVAVWSCRAPPPRHPAFAPSS